MPMTLKYEFSIQEVADKFIAVAKNRETETVEKVFNLNETGALLLKALQEGLDVSAIADRLVAEYDIQPADAESEVQAFIDMLVRNGLATL